MCVIFIYHGSDDEQSDYSFIIASNRDELYDRPALNLAIWTEDSNVVGGRDLEASDTSGTWLAISPQRRKIGVLLNLPGYEKHEAQSRGKIVANYIKSEISTQDFIEKTSKTTEQYNGYVLVTVEFGKFCSTVYTYCNVTNELQLWTESFLGFSNSLPQTPLKKAEVGKCRLKDIVSRFNKINTKELLIEELLNLLKSKERHLPDIELQRQQPVLYENLSSTFVHIPEKRYGTRTHTIVVATKTGHIDVIEVTRSLQSPIDSSDPKWTRTHLQYEI